MKLSVSQALCEAPDIFQHWEVTPEVIVFLLTTPSLQARNWEGELLWQVDVAEDEPWGLSVGGGFVFVGAESGAVMEFDLASGSPSYVYLAHDSPTNLISTAYNRSGSLLVISGSFDGSIQVWDQTSKTRLFHLTGVHTRSIFTFEVKENILVSTGGPSVALWNLSTGELLQVFSREDVRMYSSILIGDKIIAAGGSGGIIWLFNRKTNEIIASLNTEARVLNGLLLYRPNVLLSTDTSGFVTLWSLDTYTRISRVKVHDHAVLTRTITGDTIFTGGKEGGSPQNACGLDCSLKSCDLLTLLDSGEVKPVERGFPCVTLWKAQVQGNKLAVCLSKRGKPHLDIWSLGE